MMTPRRTFISANVRSVIFVIGTIMTLVALSVGAATWANGEHRDIRKETIDQERTIE